MLISALSSSGAPGPLEPPDTLSNGTAGDSINLLHKGHFALTETDPVFHIGANKAGTTSMWLYYNDLPGKWNPCHDMCAPQDTIEWATLTHKHDKSAKIWHTHRAFMDNGDIADFEWLYHAFPNSRFVMNVRSLKDWLVSRYDMVRTIRLGGGCSAEGTHASCKYGWYRECAPQPIFSGSHCLRSRQTWTGNAPHEMRGWIMGLAKVQRKQLKFFKSSSEHINRFVMADFCSDGHVRDSLQRLAWVSRKDLEKIRTKHFIGLGDALPFHMREVKMTDLAGPHHIPHMLSDPHPSSSEEHIDQLLAEWGCEEHKGDHIYLACADKIKQRGLNFVESPEEPFPSAHHWYIHGPNTSALPDGVEVDSALPTSKAGEIRYVPASDAVPSPAAVVDPNDALALLAASPAPEAGQQEGEQESLLPSPAAPAGDEKDTVVWEFANASIPFGDTAESKAGHGFDRPHLVLWVTDDQGWANVGFHNKHVRTPTMDRLATEEGITLERQYTYTWCSPSRASLMTGRLPHRLMEQEDHFVPKRIAMLPAILKKAGYATAHVGKWHLGNAHLWQTPESRGFDYSHGFLGSAIDYHTLAAEAGAFPCNGTDAWRMDKPAYGAEGAGTSLHQQNAEIVEVITGHKKKHKGKPLFLYAAIQSMHSPKPEPAFNTALYSEFSESFAVANGLITQADNMLEHAVRALKAEEMWADTLFVHMSDNGGSITPVKQEVRGNNYPLRGGKNTPFEGGVRVPAFVTGGYVPVGRRGNKLEGMIHLADWMPTFARLAGLALGKKSESPDGVDVWSYLTGHVKESPRTSALLSTHNTRVGSMDAYLEGDWKLLLGHALCDCYVTLTYPNEKEGEHSCNCDATLENAKYHGKWLHTSDGMGPKTWLFNLAADPTESHNVATSHAAKAEEMRRALEKEKKRSRHHLDPDQAIAPHVLKKKCEVFTAKHKGYVGPFLD